CRVLAFGAFELVAAKGAQMPEVKRLPAQSTLLDEIVDGEHAVRGAYEAEYGRGIDRSFGFPPVAGNEPGNHARVHPGHSCKARPGMSGQFQVPLKFVSQAHLAINLRHELLPIACSVLRFSQDAFWH